MFEKNKIKKLFPVFATIHYALVNAIGKLSFAEFRELAAEKDLWYIPVQSVETVKFEKYTKEVVIFRLVRWGDDVSVRFSVPTPPRGARATGEPKESQRRHAKE